jgi:glycosyltransferase involved in cell wall biosynthesis
LEKKHIYYWSPYLTEIATTKAVINSAYSINRYSKYFKAFILDAAGEFSQKQEELDKKNLEIIKLYNHKYISYLPKYGYFFSRISFIIIFILTFLRLKKIIQKKNPEYLIIHLITSLPLILFSLFKFKTKCILRISGYPRLGLLKTIFWKFMLNNIYKVTCPSLATYNYLKELNIVQEEKLSFLPDPIINVKEINILKRDVVKNNFNNYIIGIGRLTKQKNFIFLINAFKELNMIYPDLKLLIFGSGEERENLKKTIISLTLTNSVTILPYTNNIYPYLKNANCFILSSLWEDPGFVLLESSFCRTFIISSDCKNGPDEIIKKNNAGLLYQTSNKSDFVKKYKQFINLNEEQKKNIKKNSLVACKKYTIFSHFNILNKILLYK